MLSSKDVAMVFDTLLSSPGMNDVVKLSVSMPRKNVLLLSRVIEKGLAVKDEPGLSEESIGQIRAVATDLLSKAGLNDLNEKLQNLRPKADA
ncbi:MAG: hypothetical protein V4539_06750 [Bacteroidota bacterium]